MINSESPKQIEQELNKYAKDDKPNPWTYDTSRKLQILTYTGGQNAVFTKGKKISTTGKCHLDFRFSHLYRGTHK